ncbi:MAG: hypothetical protein IT161_06450 [Bryobacterales bacterium]|nr:hypothetical protein [Bryobacterales bacterium]
MRSQLLLLSAITLLLAGCSKAPEPAKEAAREAAPASPKDGTPPAGQTPAPAESTPAPAPQAEPAAPPPQPKTYTLAAGTPVSVRTMDAVNTKNTKTENEFEATLTSPLEVDGHTLAKAGATVIGRVVKADQGGRVKGKASLTLALSRVRLASGSYLNIKTNSVTQEAKSGTKKNMVRTGIMAGAGAAIGAIAGGGKGAAIGAGIGGGAGVATNLATRGPAAEIPSESVLNFSLTAPASVTEKP